MSIHHVHGQEVHFGHETDSVHHLFKQDENRHEFKRHFEEWQRHGEAHFTVDGKRFRIVGKEGEDGKMMPSVERYHH